jgi:hypothetical protein
MRENIPPKKIRPVQSKKIRRMEKHKNRKKKNRKKPKKEPAKTEKNRKNQTCTHENGKKLPGTGKQTAIQILAEEDPELAALARDAR